MNVLHFSSDVPVCHICAHIDMLHIWRYLHIQILQDTPLAPKSTVGECCQLKTSLGAS